MIGRLAGTVAEKQPDRVLLDVAGVGYDVAIPLGTFTALPAVGERATLQIFTHVREEALLLFGFATRAEKSVFEKLISVSGVGPKVALTVLSGLPLPELVRAIVAQDSRRLSTIPGIGKKLAERLGLELKEKLSELLVGEEARPAAPRTSAADDAVGALKNLGYKLSQAESAVATAAKETAGDDVGALIQAALKVLSKG